MAKPIPMDERVIIQSAKATIKNLMNGIVELVTNSDDSYKRLEQEGKSVEGKIEIYVNRKKGGSCERLIVKDFAEGMTREELEKAILFGGETSGFVEGKSVRGFFGRGLKETIIALGEGTIRTIKNHELHETRLWVDEKKKPQYDDELLDISAYSDEPNGTTIDIKITNKNIKIPELEKFKEQLARHYALRDIMSSDKREVKLIFEDLRRLMKDFDKIHFVPPEGTKVFDKIILLPKYGDSVDITIYESPEPLDSPRNNPYGLAGILIRTKSAILDNQLFKFENEPAALYFWGEAFCDGLEERIRNGETDLIDFNRGGLSWENEYCKELELEIESILAPLVYKKKSSLEKRPAKEIEEPTKRMLRKLCSLLNEIAKEELDEEGFETLTPDLELSHLVIKPEFANIPLDTPRSFSIYAPSELVENEGTLVTIDCDNPTDIRPLASMVNLGKHPKYPGKIWYKDFKVVGRTENAKANLIATIGNQSAYAKVRVAMSKKRKKGKITPRKGGFISDIELDESESPKQRTFYDRNSGIIKIFVNFPSVEKFIKSGLEGMQAEDSGKVLLAELIGEAFCKELARRRLEIDPPPPGGEIDAYNEEINRIQKSSLHLIQELIFEWKFK